jgi:hypothetical protein
MSCRLDSTYALPVYFEIFYQQEESLLTIEWGPADISLGLAWNTVF